MTVAEWDEVFQRRSWGRWPSTRFVEWAMRTFGNAGQRERGDIRFLEVGCGAGAQIKFLCDEGFQAFGVDGSLAALEQAKHNIPVGFWSERPRPYLWHADIEAFEPPPVPRSIGLSPVGPEAISAQEAISERLDVGGFDCVLDVCTLQHLSEAGAAHVVRKARRWLKPGGYLFSMHAAHRYADRPWTPPPSDVPEPRLLPFNAIPDIYRGFERQVSEEVVTSFDGFERRHWIITGRKV